MLNLISETIFNEHPVTIYPGPLPLKRVPPPISIASLERHQDTCRKILSSDTSPLQESLEIESPSLNWQLNLFDLRKNDSENGPKSLMSVSPIDDSDNLRIKISIQSMDNLMNNRNIIHNAKLEQNMVFKNPKRISTLIDEDESFSDDSLEDTSLPPPAPPPVIPPPPSLSAPVTPSKRHSIAWEVNLDDLCSFGNKTRIKVRNFLNIIGK